MPLFNNYLNNLRTILDDSPSATRVFNKSMDSIFESYNGRSAMPENKAAYIIKNKTLFTFDKEELVKYFGKNKYSFDEITLGMHPEFSSLKFDQYEYHHCVSMFVDIKGSTRLALNHSLEEVRLIKDSLLTLCIHVANFFGGHVHRLQGDAAFIQFVRRGAHENDSIINALNAATVLSQFVTNDLSTLFAQKDLNPIKIRIGIDYGSNDKVLWSYYGIPGCHELTTTSLHTDLAAKLQAKAANNTIRIGKNIVTALDLPDEYYYVPTVRVNGKEESDYYILKSPELNYNQYVFDWEKYLNSFDFITKRANGTLEILPKQFELRAELKSSDNTISVPYFQNSHAIPKGHNITYTLLRDGRPYNKVPSEEIVWQAINRGAEAVNAKQSLHDFGGSFTNKNHCDTTAAYLGHHILKCSIKRFSENVVLKFPIYVR